MLDFPGEILHIHVMRHLAIILAMCIFAGQVAAQNDETAEDDGPSLIERGAELFLEGLLREMEPAIDDLQALADEIGPSLRGFASAMGPALRELLEDVEDWTAYHPPEVQENGDIIIRRKKPEELNEGDAQVEI